ncbi:unnamed protein product, partial [Medioppia subpectinata]
SNWLSPDLTSLGKPSPAVTLVDGLPEDHNPMTQLSPISAMSSLIGSDEIRERQQNLMKMIDKCSYVGRKSNLVLISGSSRQHMADTRIPSSQFKQNSEFIYLTGFTSTQSSDCVLALIGGNGEPLQSILFAPFEDSVHQLWDGNDMREHSVWINSICDELRDLSKLNELIVSEIPHKQLFVSRSGLNQSNGNNSENCDKLSPRLTTHLNLNTNTSIHRVSPFLDQLRAVKSKAECNAMRRVCDIGSQAILNSMVWTKQLSEHSLVNESQIAAKFEFESRVNGARKISFPTVCGSGQRSTIIHYGANDQFCATDDWVLMDAGCEDVDGYNSDITRTWPINGNFGTNRLRNDLYEALCEVQSDLIAAVSSDSMMTLDLLFKLMCDLLGKVLLEFNVLNTTVSAQEAASLAHRFCPHHVSHYLGLDIHDCPSVSRNTILKAGHCFTVEPGLYFHRNQTLIKPEFKGIGMRVEDDLLINSEGQIEVLSKGCPHKPNLI